MNKEEFYKELEKINIDLSPIQKEQLTKFYLLLVEWNQKLNLTRIIEENDVYLKHFYDSLTICKIIDLNNYSSLCDIGSGAGFPGIVLKIVYPHLNITLLDSLQKRVNYLNNIINKLELKDIKAIHERAEDYSNRKRESFDIVTARAVANTNMLLEISSALVKENGFYVLMKGQCEEEFINAKEAINKLNLEVSAYEEFLLPIEKSHRTLIKLKKIAKTPKNFPRKIELIKKKPLS